MMRLHIPQRLNPCEWVRQLEAAREEQRVRTLNAAGRADEVHLILHRGSQADRRQYLTASAAWRAAGQPDVPRITGWYTSQPLVPGLDSGPALEPDPGIELEA